MQKPNRTSLYYFDLMPKEKSPLGFSSPPFLCVAKMNSTVTIDAFYSQTSKNVCQRLSAYMMVSALRNRPET
jgi:hypothetical protein